MIGPRARHATRRSQAGQGMTEFATVAVVFLLLLFGIMSAGDAVFTYNTVAAATREAVRYASVHGPSSPNPATTAQIQQVAINNAPSLNLTTSQVTVAFPGDAQLPAKKDAQVSISYPYTVHIPLMSAITVTLKSSSQMLVSQ